MDGANLSRNPAAMLGALAAACAGGVVMVYVFNLRQLAFTSFGAEDGRFIVQMPSQACSALGSVAAGFIATSRAIRGPALLAIVVSAGLILLGQDIYRQGPSGPMELAAMVCALSVLGAAITVLGLVAIVQASDRARTLLVMTALAVPVGFPYILNALEMPADVPLPSLAALGAGAIAVLLWAPSNVQSPEVRLAFAPVGPAPLSVRGAPSQTPQLALLVIAATVIGWAGFQAPHLGNAYFENLNLIGTGIVLAFGVAAMAIGETSAARAVAAAIALVFIWTLGGGPPEAGLAGAGVAGSLADFSATVLASRYGQPADMAKRIGVLMGLSTASFIPLNLIVVSAGPNGFFSGEGDNTLLLVAAGASLLVLALLLQLPRARSPGAAW